MTILPQSRRAYAKFCKIKRVVGLNEFFVLERRLYEELSILDKDILFRYGGFFELPITKNVLSMSIANIAATSSLPETAHFGFLGPDLWIQSSGEILNQHRTIIVSDDSLETVIHKKPGKCKSDGQSNEWYYGDPFFTGIFFGQPGPLNLALFHSAGMEVSLLLLLLVQIYG